MSAPACYGLCRCRHAFLCFVLLLYFAEFCRTAIFQGPSNLWKLWGDFGEGRPPWLGWAQGQADLSLCLCSTRCSACTGMRRHCACLCSVSAFQAQPASVRRREHACRAWWLLRVSSLQHCQAWCAGALGAPAGALYLPHSCRTPASFLPGSAQFVRWTRVLGYSLARGPERLG